MMNRRRALHLMSTAPFFGHVAPTYAAGDPYVEQNQGFRCDRETTLKSEDGWLSVVGLHWLHPGETRIGSDPSCDVLLPSSAPPVLGKLILEDDRATFRASEGVQVTCRDMPFTSGLMHSDAGGTPDVLASGTIRLILLRRGKRFALRVKDSDSPMRRSFKGLRWFPIDPSWKIQARFVPSRPKTQLIFDTIVGEQEESESAGEAEFERNGKTWKLRAAKEPDGSLWFVFRDGTSGRTTAGNARQLTVPAPTGGRLVLDFNRATNLPCAYIPYATCPLAPPQNRLSLPITAGEMKYEAGKL